MAIVDKLQPLHEIRGRMIRELDYVGQSDDLLYHYCSPATMLAILTGRKLRFSDVFSMNDTSEYHWGSSLLARCLKEHGSEFAAGLGECLGITDDVVHKVSITTACCLSTDGDVLSQWRAYAENGTGFAIGFDPCQLAKMGARLMQVRYLLDDQRAVISAVLNSIEEFAPDCPYSPSGVPGRVGDLMLDMVGFKNPAFREEKEVRLIQRIAMSSDPHRTFYATDTGQKDVELQFLMRGSNPAVYLDIDLPQDDPGIRRIVVGPRADVELRAIRILLGAKGLPDVAVDRSEATYR